MSRERVRELRPFLALARVAGGPYSALELLERICTEARSGFGFAGALVLRSDGASVQAAVCQNIAWPDAAVAIDEVPPLAEAAASGHSLVSSARWPGGEDCTRVVVPLVLEDRCVGFLLADGPDEPVDASGETLALLGALGVVAAVLVDRADSHGGIAGVSAELQHADGVKSDVVGIASHELRTPIAVVHGIAATLHLRGDDLDHDQLVDLRTTLYEQTTRLAALTQSLLDLSRIESGSMQVQPRRLRPRERVIALLQQIAPDDGVRVEIPEDLELVTDADGIDRVVGNLVTNALRYGGPPVEIRAEPGPPFRLAVRDHGPGVDPAFVDRLFERFTRGSRARGSAGLGLAIARSYAYALGGDLRYERANPGARFELVLPGG